MDALALSTLVDWARRAGGDRIQEQNQTSSSDGSGLVRLKATGYITVTQVMIGVVVQNPSTYTVNSNVVVFTSPPARGLKITVFYTVARYSDNEILDYLNDSVRGLAGTLKATFTVDTSNVVTDTAPANQPFSLNNDAGLVRPEIEELIVLRASLNVFADKANDAAANAIKIKDGDTAIDTATTAGASEKAAARLYGQYKAACNKVLSEGFIGVSGDLELIPPRFLTYFNTFRSY